MISIEWQTVLDSEDEVRVRNKGPAKHDHNILVWISIVENSLHVIRSIPSGKKNGPGPEVNREIQRFVGGVFCIFIVGHAWFDQVDVAETELFGLGNHVGKLRDRVPHAHTLEGAPGAQTESDALGADGIAYGPHDLVDKTRAVLDAAAVLVGADVADVLREAIDKIAVRAVELDAVETRADSVLRRSREVVHDPLYLVGRQSPRHGSGLVVRYGARGHQLNALGLGSLWVRGTANMNQLTDDEAAVTVHLIGDGLPRRHLVVSPDARCIGEATSARRDDPGLGDDQGTCDLRPLAVVLLHHGRGSVVVTGP